ARLLHLRDCMESERRLSARLGAIDLDDASSRIAADAERDVQPNASRRDDLDSVSQRRPLFEAHDRALAVFLFDGGDGKLDCLALILGIVHGEDPSSAGARNLGGYSVTSILGIRSAFNRS